MAIARSCSKPSGATSRRCELATLIASGRLLSSYKRSNPQFQGSAEQRCCSAPVALRAPVPPELQR